MISGLKNLGRCSALLAVGLVASQLMLVESASADSFCRRIRPKAGKPNVTIVNKTKCPSGYRRVTDVLSSDDVKALALSVMQANSSTLPKGPKGDKGDKGEQGAKGADATTTQVINIVDTRLADPIPYLAYEVGPVEVLAGNIKVVAVGHARIGAAGAWETRVVVKSAFLGDFTPYLDNSNVIADSGFVQATNGNFSGSQSSLTVNGMPVMAWFVAPSNGHKFPILRMTAAPADLSKFTSCAQGTVDQPKTDDYDNKPANAAGACPFGSAVSSKVVELTGDGIPATRAGVGIASDASTMSHICAIKGYDGYSNYSNSSWNSCDDNTIIRWRNGVWEVSGACSYNSRITSLRCFKLSL